MSSSSSNRCPIRSACSAGLLLVLAATAPWRCGLAQQQDEALVGQLARLLAAADARAFDAALFRETLHHPDPGVRRQAALAIGRDEGAGALHAILGTGSTPGVPTSLAQSTALVEAWRLGTRAPVPSLVGFAEDPDPTARWHALYTLARLRVARGVPALLRAL